MKPGKNINKSRFSQQKDDKGENREKKPFDKKAYRLKKYSNKYKVTQWEERRKKAVLREYYKELQRDKGSKKSLVSSEDPEDDSKNKKPKKTNAFLAAKLEFQRKKEEKQQKKEEALKVKAEREEARRQRELRLKEVYKKLAKKTKRGQPVMKDRLEMLLEKIQQVTHDSPRPKDYIK